MAKALAALAVVLLLSPQPDAQAIHDTHLMAQLVYHEARGECFDGQVAVAEVVLNRVASPLFPNTIEEVVMQRTGRVWQFSPAPYIDKAKPGPMQYNAVLTAMREHERVVSEDSLYFSMAPYNSKITAHIGCHWFCKE